MTSLYIDDSRRALVYSEYTSGVSSVDYPGHFPNKDESWDLDRFTKNVVVKVQRLSKRSCELDIVGVDASIANALRRILIAEVPTIAIEHVYVFNNTSVIQDEVLAHRLGLVPLNVDPSLIEMKENDVATDRNTIVFRLQVACTRNINAAQGETAPQKLYHNSEVLTSNFEWVPQGEQSDIFMDNPPWPAIPDILLVKMRPGQEIDIEMHAIKGVGAKHIKWSPVSTVSYRLHPYIHIKGRIPQESIPKFVSCFSPGVMEIRENDQNEDEPVVVSARKDAMTREVLRYNEFHDKVEISRIKDWFIFNIESDGAYAPERLLIEAISIMRDKLAVVRKAVVALEADSDVDIG